MNLSDVQIIVTDHALQRWRERASIHACEHKHRVVDAVRKARLMTKDEPLPFNARRRQRASYAFDGTVLYVLESASNSFVRVVTLWTEPVKVGRHVLAKPVGVATPAIPLFPEPESRWDAERQLAELSAYNKAVVRQINSMPKGTPGRRELLREIQPTQRHIGFIREWLLLQNAGRFRDDIKGLLK